MYLEDLDKKTRRALEAEARRLGITIDGLVELIALRRVAADLRCALESAKAEIQARTLPPASNVIKFPKKRG